MFKSISVQEISQVLTSVDAFNEDHIEVFAYKIQIGTIACLTFKIEMS